MDIRCGWEGEIHVGIVSEHEHERLGKEGNGGEHICMCKSKGMGWVAWVSQIMVMVVRRSFP